MSFMKNVADIKDCFGCGLCATVCAHKVIDIRLNDNGFWGPVAVDPSKCTECGLCMRVCSFINHSQTSSPVKCYAGWSNDDDVRNSSTSGGVSYELAKHLISEGYKFCGVRYNADKCRAEHYIASTVEELAASKGSKYLQSFTLDALSGINRKEKYMVVGTPCHIASFRRYLDLFNCQDNFILVDFFCHGVPSYHLWDKYLDKYSSGLGEIRSATWRNKEHGWRRSYCVSINGEKDTYRAGRGYDEFYTMFLGDACLNKPCYTDCRFKYDRSAADIRIGDFWGEKFKDDDCGVNAIMVYSQTADTVLREADLNLNDCLLSEAVSGQMRSNADYPRLYPLIMRGLRGRYNVLSILSGMVYVLKKLRLWR